MESVQPIVMNPTERIVSGLFAGGFAVAVATVALIDPIKSSIFPVCPLLRFTGFACPGCGVTRGFHALFHGDFLGALDFNALIPIYAVALGFLFVSLVFVAVRGRGLNLGKIPASLLVPHPYLVWIKGQLFRHLLYKIILPSTDHIFVQSQRMKEDVMAQDIPAEKMTPVPMGICSDQVGTTNDAQIPNIKNPTLLYLGTIMQLRQSEILVRVLHRVKTRYPGARLIYVGEGQNSDDRHAVENEAVRLGLLSDVTITGFLPMSEAWKLVKQADICFSPFYPVPVLLSTSPTKLNEYMAMAKCIIANEHPEQQEVMSASGVGRCIPWDEQAFAEEVFYLLEDPERAKNMAAKGPDWVRVNRTYNVIADFVELEYKKKILGKIVCPT